MKKFSMHFSDSYLTEASISKMDLFKRQNKQTFLDRAGKGELISMKGEKLPIKDKAIWNTVKSDIEKATSHSDLPDDFTRRLGKAIAPMSQIDKTANGMSTMSGKDPSGEDWEAGITVALDKLSGRNFMDTPEWERFGKYWGDWEEQAMRTAEAFKKELKITELKQTGSQRATLSKGWKGTNKTPKTDLLGGKHRISLKKEGGSQLMSAGKEEAISTLEAAMATYGVSGKGKREFNQLLKSFEDNLIKMSEKGQMSTLRKSKDKALQKEIEIADVKTAKINEDIEQYINNSIGFKSHFCWEAATGHGKFGQDTWPTATLIVTFKEAGGISKTLILDSPDKAGKVLAKGNDFYASFKSSGNSAPYLSLRSKGIAKSKLVDDYIPTFSEIITEETVNSGLFLTEDLQQLDEFQMLNKLKKGAKSVSSSVVNAAKKALAVIQKRLSQAFNMIKRLGAKAWKGLLNFFGLVVNNVTVRGGGSYPLL
jgi:hypothetical protein